MTNINISEFGFTNDPKLVVRVRAWRDAAVADGWSITPTYTVEDVDRAFRMQKDGWVAQGLLRYMSDSRKWSYQASIYVWAPDGLAVTVPIEYDFNELVRRTRICAYCNAEDVDTERVSFAGRCCIACLPSIRKRVEYPGWAN